MSEPAAPAAAADVGLGNCRCGALAIVAVGGPRSPQRPVCIRCFAGVLDVARTIGDLARDAGVDVVMNVHILIGGGEPPRRP